MKIKFIAILTIIGLCSCVQQQKRLTASELEQIKEEVRQEMKAQQDTSSTTQGTTEATTEDAQKATSIDASLKEKAYKKGYDSGMAMHTLSLDFFTSENEKRLKDEYMFQCRTYGGLGEQYYNNRELYNEFRRGFMKGYEDGNNAL